MPSNFDLVIHLFLQLTVILLACRALAALLRPLGQAAVVAEMIAGVLLGPSLLGQVWPGAQEFLFPRTLPGGGTHPSMTVLYALSQLGLVLYMFVIGLHFDARRLSGRFGQAAGVSLSGVAAPLVLGGVLGWLWAADPRLFGPGLAPGQAALFLGAAMAITAFPMLARIIHESGLTHTRLGTLTLGAAALDDAAAWCLLAVVLATLQGDPAIAALAVGGGAVYALVTLRLARPLLGRFAGTVSAGVLHPPALVLLLALLMGCAWFTDRIGIYSIFGAFVLGAALPRGAFAEAAGRTVEPLTVTLLLPIFFVYSGLNTRLSLLLDPAVLGAALLIVAVAFLCKGGACLLASRLGGASWRDAALIGVLMNARGLMELILINIGLERGIITPALFTALALMAVLTTFVASPLFAWVRRGEPGAAPGRAVEEAR